MPAAVSGLPDVVHSCYAAVSAARDKSRLDDHHTYQQVLKEASARARAIFQNGRKSARKSGIQQCLLALKALHDDFANALKEAQSADRDLYLAKFRNILQSSFLKHVEHFRIWLRTVANTFFQNEKSLGSTVSLTKSQGNNFDQCVSCMMHLESAFGKLWQVLVIQELEMQIHRHVRAACKASLEEDLLPQLVSWLDDHAVPFLRRCSGRSESEDDQMKLAEMRLEDLLRDSHACYGAELIGIGGNLANGTDNRLHLVPILLEAMALERISQAFDIVKMFPDSKKALRDLRYVMRPSHAKTLIAHLKEQFSKRLLTAGVETRRIILAYCKTVGAIKFLCQSLEFLPRDSDPSTGTGNLEFHILEAVTSPIKSYLQQRRDTVRCVIGNIAEEGEMLQFEFDTKEKDETCTADQNENPDQWMPEPMHSEWGGLHARARHSSWKPDLISLLVSIYSSQDGFISEYKDMLAERLITAQSYNTRRERHLLELLKTRFGDDALQLADVMLDDVQDSRRIHHNVLLVSKKKGGNMESIPECEPADGAENTERMIDESELESASSRVPDPKMTSETLVEDETMGSGENDLASSSDSVQGPVPVADILPLVISEHFWPLSLDTDDDDEIYLPSTMENGLKKYAEAYTAFRPTRKLSWRKKLGTVELELDIGDTTQIFSVTPPQAAVIHLFQDKDTALHLSEIVEVLNLSESVTRQAVRFWAARNIISEISTDLFDITSHDAGSNSGNVVDFLAAPDKGTAAGDSLMEDAQARNRQKELEVLNDLVIGMLKNYQQLPLHKLHKLLQMCMSQETVRYTHTEAELGNFLDDLCDKALVDFDGIKFSLPKKE